MTVSTVWMVLACDWYFKYLTCHKKGSTASHVGKYDRADDRPKLAMLAAKVGYRYWTDDRSRLG